MVRFVISIVYVLEATIFAFHVNSPHGNRHGSEDNTSMGPTRHADLVDEIADQLQVHRGIDGRTLFSMNDMERLFERLSFQNCTRPSVFARCNLCISPHDVLSWYGLTSVQITGSEMQDMSVGIVYILSDYVDHVPNRKEDGDACGRYVTRLLRTNTSQLYSMFVNNYETGRIANNESFWKIIGNINKTLDYRLTERSCFTAHDHLNVFSSDAFISDHEELRQATTFILTKLLNLNCLEHDENQDLLFDIGRVLYTYNNLYLTTVARKLSSTVELTPNRTTCFNTTRQYLVSEISLSNSSIITGDQLREFAQRFIQVSRRECGHNNTRHEEQDHGLTGRDDHDENEDHHDDHGDEDEGKKIQSAAWRPWISTLVAITIISVASLIGILTVGNRERKYFQHCISFLISLGVSVLICDAILHLIPHSLGLHGDGHDYDSDEEGHDDAYDHESVSEDHFGPNSYLWKAFAILIGVYLFLVLELLMSTFCSAHGHSHNHKDEAKKETKASDNVEMRMPPVVSSNEINIVMAPTAGELMAKKPLTVKSINTVAWMILIGDGVHNFMDGVAIGGVFSEPFPAGLQDGVMTSIAILLHELPHELADFAVLISTGLTTKQALLLNLLSSLTAFAGGIVGIVLGTEWDASSWILAITAGLFLYISLGTMLPEVLHNPLLKTFKPLVLIDCLGLLVGLIIMILLAGYEEALTGALKPK